MVHNCCNVTYDVICFCHLHRIEYFIIIALIYRINAAQKRYATQKRYGKPMLQIYLKKKKKIK